MKTFQTIILFVLVSLLMVASASAEEMTKEYRIWLGSHSLDFTDYSRKVGEFESGESTSWMAGEFEYLSYGLDRQLSIKSKYINDKDYSLGTAWVVGTRSSGKISFSSYERQQGQDLLENLSAREWLPTTSSFSGKMLTHAILDPGAEYSIQRKEMNSEFNLLISDKNNIRLMTSHKSIWKDGHAQVLASSHCASCHVESRRGQVKTEQHQLTAGLQADVNRMTIGYELGYRKFESKTEESMVYYEQARHPVNGGAVGEFGSRVIFDDTVVSANTSPTTEKYSHRLRFKGDVGKGRLSGSIRMFKSTNKDMDLQVDGVSGAFNYSRRLSPKTRLVAKVSGSKIENDPIDIDLPTYREGSGGDIDFDYTRVSSLNRTTGKLSSELFHKLNKTTSGSLLFGYETVTRTDYPFKDADQASSQLFTQMRLKYRPNSDLSTSLKYRLELTSDPLVSAKGLFEARGHGTLYPVDPDTAWIFYYQREELRYQNITTLPTQKHELDAKIGYRFGSGYSANFGLKYLTEKNDELDSLDVKRTVMRPSISFTGLPSDKFMFTAGFNMNKIKSRGPVAVALFDG